MLDEALTFPTPNSAQCNLTSQLCGTRQRRAHRGYFIPIHRFPPTINEDDAPCPLQRKLEGKLTEAVTLEPRTEAAYIS
jgi:hypothetical protein